jgi:hypothetical protein
MSTITFYTAGKYEYYYDGQCASVYNQYSIVNGNYMYTFFYCTTDLCNHKNQGRIQINRATSHSISLGLPLLLIITSLQAVLLTANPYR